MASKLVGEMTRDELRRYARQQGIVVSRGQRATKASLLARIRGVLDERRRERITQMRIERSPENAAQYLADLWGTRIRIECGNLHRTISPQRYTQRRTA